MSIAQVTEISARSTEGFDDAVAVGLRNAAAILRGVQSAWVKDRRVTVANGRVAEYQVNIMVTCPLD